MIYSSYQILQVLLGKSESNFIRIISLFFFYTSYQLVANPWVLSTQILSISFDLFIIALTSFSYLSFNRISIVLLNWLIKLIYFFTRINLLNLVIDIVIQLLYVSSYFQYTYILQLISKLRESIDQCLVENINRYFRGRKIDLLILSGVINRRPKRYDALELYRKSTTLDRSSMR